MLTLAAAGMNNAELGLVLQVPVVLFPFRKSGGVCCLCLLCPRFVKFLFNLGKDCSQCHLNNPSLGCEASTRVVLAFHDGGYNGTTRRDSQECLQAKLWTESRHS